MRFSRDTEKAIYRLYEILDTGWCSGEPYDAAVAIVYVPGKREILMIERREAEGDPWSGHIAFPGGRREEGDLNSYYTSLRELREEIYLGDVELLHIGAMKTYTSRRTVKIVPHIFISETPVEVSWSREEVEKASWVSIDDLREVECPPGYTPRCFITSVFRKIVWGVTGRILGDLTSVLRSDEARAS